MKKIATVLPLTLLSLKYWNQTVIRLRNEITEMLLHVQNDSYWLGHRSNTFSNFRENPQDNLKESVSGNFTEVSLLSTTVTIKVTKKNGIIEAYSQCFWFEIELTESIAENTLTKCFFKCIKLQNFGFHVNFTFNFYFRFTFSYLKFLKRTIYWLLLLLTIFVLFLAAF